MTLPGSEPLGAFRITGRVLGPDARAVAGAEVWIDPLPRRATKSDVDGTFELDELVSRSYEVRAKSDELVGGPLIVRSTQDARPVQITMREGTHVVVTVVDATFAPIANAEVRVVDDDTVTTTNEMGEARVTTKPGWIDLEVSAAGHAPRRASTVIGAFGATGRIEILLHEGFSVTGRVVDEQVRPIANARIYARPSPLGSAAFPLEGEKTVAMSDRDGAFTVPSVAGMHAFVAVDSEHAPGSTNAFDVDRAITGVEIVMKRSGVYARPRRRERNRWPCRGRCGHPFRVP